MASVRGYSACGRLAVATRTAAVQMGMPWDDMKLPEMKMPFFGEGGEPAEDSDNGAPKVSPTVRVPANASARASARGAHFYLTRVCAQEEKKGIDFSGLAQLVTMGAGAPMLGEWVEPNECTVACARTTDAVTLDSRPSTVSRRFSTIVASAQL